MKCLEIKNLYKKFDNDKNNEVLSDISFSLEEGKTIALIGADGSGKTTLLRIITGLLCKTSGDIAVLGLDPEKDKSNILKDIGYMPQKFGLYEDLTVIENLNLYKKLKNSEADFDKLLDFTGLKRFQNRLAGNLSGGMKQKLGLACALIKKPKLLILDEASTGVDPLSRIELLELVNNTKDDKTSMIWSSSYLDEAYHFDLSIILDKGKIIFNDKTKKLGKDYIDFEKNVIELMGGYKEQESQVAKNYHITEYNRECVVLADKLSKKFGDFTAVKNNSFCIKKGEIFGLLGPNGAGKSTTFQMMCGLIKITSGSGYIMGVDIKKEPAKARSYIGYMAQKFSLYSQLNVVDNLNFFAGIYGLSGKEKTKRIERLLDIFELKDYKNIKTSILPTGFKQRLSLSCALIHEPPVLFLDEPTSGVDVIQRKEFWNHIRSLSDIGVSILVTTHFMDEARYCNKISLFYEGEIIALDKPDEIIKKSAAKNMQEAFIELIKQARQKQ